MDDKKYMEMAIELAKQAADAGEVPVGAVVVSEGVVVASAYNQREGLKSPGAHAEVLAIEAAAKKLGRWRLSDCTVYVTLEPCVMCAGLMHQARVARCVFGAKDEKAGALGTLYNVASDERLNHNFEVTGGMMADECAGLLSEFFKERR